MFFIEQHVYKTGISLAARGLVCEWILLNFNWNQAASQIRIFTLAQVNFRRLPSFVFNADEELFCRLRACGENRAITAH